MVELQESPSIGGRAGSARSVEAAASVSMFRTVEVLPLDQVFDPMLLKAERDQKQCRMVSLQRLLTPRRLLRIASTSKWLRLISSGPFTSNRDLLRFSRGLCTGLVEMMLKS